MNTSTVLTMRIPLSPQSWLRECVCNIWFSAQDVKSQQAGHLLSIREIKADRGQRASPISTKGHWTALHCTRSGPRSCSVSGANAWAKAACRYRGIRHYWINNIRKHISLKCEFLFWGEKTKPINHTQTSYGLHWHFLTNSKSAVGLNQIGY